MKCPYKFFCVADSFFDTEASQREVAVQILYHAKVEKSTDKIMGYPGKLSPKEQIQLEQDIQTAQTALIGYSILMGTINMNPEEFVKYILSNNLFIHFAEHYVANKSTGEMFNWTIVNN